MEKQESEIIFDFYNPKYRYHSFISAIIKLKPNKDIPNAPSNLNPKCDLCVLFYEEDGKFYFKSRLKTPGGMAVVKKGERTQQEMNQISTVIGDFFQVVFHTICYSTDFTGENLLDQIQKNSNIELTGIENETH